jgi:hypothetical protein
MAYDFKLRSEVLSSGKTANYAQLIPSEEPEFFVAYNTKYIGMYGLYNPQKKDNVLYKSESYADKYDFWAHFIYPTSNAESNNSFICLNTYDRAYFTFGFMQFAAHVPNGDFVTFFREILALPEATNYFPRLRLINNRIFYQPDQGTPHQLEFDNTSQGLMEYLNPGLKEVERQELICAARLIHWTTTHADVREIQVKHSVELYKTNMVKYNKRFSLNGYPAKVCFMICDILHQGRGTYDRIAYAINTGGNYNLAYENLCTVGDKHYQSRIDTLKAIISTLEGNGIFKKKYDSATNTFIA